MYNSCSEDHRAPAQQHTRHVFLVPSCAGAATLKSQHCIVGPPLNDVFRPLGLHSSLTSLHCAAEPDLWCRRILHPPGAPCRAVPGGLSVLLLLWDWPPSRATRRVQRTRPFGARMPMIRCHSASCRGTETTPGEGFLGALRGRRERT